MSSEIDRLLKAAKQAVRIIRRLDAFDDYVTARSELELAIAGVEQQAEGSSPAPQHALPLGGSK